MNDIGKFMTASALTLGLTLPPACLAQANTEAAAAASLQADRLTEGEIRRLDLEAGKLTIRHGEIRNLDMPPMIMVFAVRDKGLLHGLKVGDRIRFAAIYEGGRYLVTDIRPFQ